MKLTNALASQSFQAKFQELFALLGTGAYTGDAELLQYEVYDRFIVSAADIAAARKEYKLFAGVQGTNKTIVDTNFEGAGVIPQGQHYEIKAMSLQVTYTGAAPITEQVLHDIVKALDNAVIRVNIANKANMSVMPLSRMLGMSLSAVVAGGAVASDETFRQISNGVYAFNIPIVLPALTSFEMLVQFQDAVSASLQDWSFRLVWQSALIRGL